jgi:hypothetical protein
MFILTLFNSVLGDSSTIARIVLPDSSHSASVAIASGIRFTKSLEDFRRAGVCKAAEMESRIMKGGLCWMIE